MKKIVLPIITIIVIVLATRCEKKEELPEYAGKWGSMFINYGPTGNDTLYLFQYKEVYDISKNTFEYTIQIKYSDDFVSIYKETGDVEVDEKNEIISFIINEWGESQVSSSQRYTGAITLEDITNDYSKNQRTNSFGYYLTDSELTLFFSDSNNDGDYYDFGEYQSFLKLD